jgi:hypothetical protein
MIDEHVFATLASLLGPRPEQQVSEVQTPVTPKSARERSKGSYIVDVTEEFMGTAIIITGAKPPEE